MFNKHIILVISDMQPFALETEVSILYSVVQMGNVSVFIFFIVLAHLKKVSSYDGHALALLLSSFTMFKHLLL